MIDKLLALGPTVLVALGVLVFAQLTLMAVALVSLANTRSERLRGPKALWVVIIVFGQMIGPIVYFTVARLPQQVDGPSFTLDGSSAASRTAETAADLLYGVNFPAGPK